MYTFTAQCTLVSMTHTGKEDQTVKYELGKFIFYTTKK